MLIRIAKLISQSTLVVRFRFISFIAIVAGTILIGRWVAERIKTSVINQSAVTTALYLDNFVVPNLQELSRSTTLTPEHSETLKKILTETNIGRQIVTIKVWDEHGRILYSNRPSLIGLVFSDSKEIPIVWQGQVVTDISNLSDAENFEERPLFKELLEIYIPVRSVATHQVIAIAEFYQKVDILEAEIAAAQRQSWLAVGLTMAVIYLLLNMFFRGAYNQLRKQEVALRNQVAQLTEVLSTNDELDQRVRRASANAAAVNERLLQRITTDLNDGPVHEINQALLQLNNAIDSYSVNLKSKENENLPIVQTSMRNAIDEVQAITNGLGLPQLDRLTLPEIFSSAVQAHEQRTGTQATLSMGDLPTEAILPIKITAYRIVQEALNNAHRHAKGAGQTVCVTFETNILKIEVADQGPGFDVSLPIAGEEHLGLAGMRERVESLGGLFTVESKINQGTKIIAQLFFQDIEAIAYA